ncbi:hypothetical protein JOF53_001932 [Crossiella equi]|uniref:Uncharacterized protein n=1 Tax=Crossiella equi TaxID=130796 RepID=A0ABS5A917_9PSEU|nr:hypothetical protein [Crossiella equi]
MAWELSHQLTESAVPHALLDGDLLCQAHPAPPHDPHRTHLTELNLSALWRNFQALGHTNLIYTNTLCVLPEAAPMFHRTLGPNAVLTRILLTATDDTTRTRLTSRELGSNLSRELANSTAKSRRLQARTPADALHIATDNRSVPALAREILAATGWPSA